MLRKRPPGPRSALEAERGHISHQLYHDCVAHITLTFHAPSRAVREVVDERPTDERGVEQWELALGLVTQHQAAFGLSQGLGRDADWRIGDAQDANRRLAVVPTEVVDTGGSTRG